MARRGRRGGVDYRQFKKLQERIDKLANQDFEKFCEAAAKELAARMLATVIKRTPVADPSTWKVPVKGYVGGTLRRGWTAGKENMSEKGNVVGVGGKTGFASTLEVVKKGNVYEIYVVNNTEYASYVEYGRRTRDHQGWIPGRFMMTISADQVEKQAPQLLEKKLFNLLKDTFGGNG